MGSSSLVSYINLKENDMESEHIKAAGNKIAGKTKEAIGDATDNKSLEAKGKAQQVKAEAQDAVGDTKDAIK